MTKIRSVASLVTAAGILLHIDDAQYVIAGNHPNAGKIKDALKNKQYDKLVQLMDARSAVKDFLSKDRDFALVNDLIQFDGAPFSNAVTDKVLNMIEAGNDAEPLFNFLRNVRENPSKTAQDELLLFCVANQFMITTEGMILAYKSVNGNYTDIHTGKISNAVGKTVKMIRNTVDDNRYRTCSSGLHFASREYASTWAGEIDGVRRRLMVMEVNPRDVVSIPSDYHDQKGRCCQYRVIAEIGAKQNLPKVEVYDHKTIRKNTIQSAPWCDCTDEYEAAQDELDRLAGIRNRWAMSLDRLGRFGNSVRRNELKRKIADISLEIDAQEDICDDLA